MGLSALIERRRDAGTRMARRVVSGLAMAGVVATGIVVGLPVAAPAEAATASNFNPGNIISDDLFYDGSAMSVSQIQAFLDAKIGTCSNSNCLNVAVIPYPGRARDVSQTTGNVVCEAISSGTMRVSELIYRTQVACGISAKVILVTLQKEQGLVLDRSPSDVSLRWAMGMACPDTAPCDTAFAGLGTQIVAGTRQLKAYKAAAFARQPGNQYVQWNPDSSCGGTYVNVQNYATAALYNYTPYQPNSAALANLYGVGNGCSSYGNRNFWTFYTDWFGSTTDVDPASAINAVYTQQGGASGVLGTVTSSPACTPSASCVWTYTGGTIAWTRSNGAVAITGAVDTAWRANKAAFGLPMFAATVVTDTHGNGVAQAFEYGTVHSSAAGTFLVPMGTMPAYSAAGWLRGDLGWPTSGLICGSSGACLQTYQGGYASTTSQGVGTIMRADIAAAYTTAGAQSGALGLPIAPQTTVTDPNGDGAVQAFQNGMIHASAKGAFSIPNKIMTAYSKAGWLRGSLGWPTSEYVCDTVGCGQSFAGGTIRTALDGSGAFVVPGVDASMQAAYAAAGGETGYLGYPSSLPSAVQDPNGNGTAQAFQGGIIHSSSAGAFAVPNAIMPTYSAKGWLRGPLGWPVGAAVCDTAGCRQDFAGGTIVAPVGQAGYVVATISDASIRTLYDTAGGSSGTFGYPVAAATTVTDRNGNGVAQAFQNGIVHVSTSGAFFVPNAVMPAYSAKGWLRGSLGWPSGTAVCDAGGCVQQFQNGTIDTH